MKVTYHVFKDYRLDVGGASDEEIFANKKYAKRLAKLRYSFVSMRYHAKRKRLFVGCTNSGGDLLVEFNPATRKFRSCGYGRSGIWEPTEAKVHKEVHPPGRSHTGRFLPGHRIRPDAQENVHVHHARLLLRGV